MPVVSQSIMKPMVPVGASTEACALRKPFFSPSLDRPRPTPWWPACARRGRRLCSDADRVVGGLVLAHHPLVGVGVAGVAGVRADDAGELGGALVGRAGHQRGDRGGHRAAAVGVVAQAHRHQQRAEVGVADAELAVVAGGLADRLGREVGEADRDVHRGDDHLDGLGEQRGVEGVVVLEELQQVQRGQVARGVVERHVLRARVGRGDPAGLGVGVPVVDGVVVLQARVGALPGGLAILRNRSRASTVSMTSPVLRARRPKSVPSSTARMNSSVTRTELLAFWYCTEVMSAPPRSMSKPASRSARILSSSRALVSRTPRCRGGRRRGRPSWPHDAWRRRT